MIFYSSQKSDGQVSIVLLHNNSEQLTEWEEGNNRENYSFYYNYIGKFV